ncbi:glycosyltransferase [Lysinibacillus sp. GbtcB16]|uniref:glycosyltransferase n=1 Tax=Lysinibacillus sp. GbtcB16 TaxID=2824761 RepID=UPI001C301C55|nr:glycosyltransferase [Lysinibacillus sp. GbtcB16]
MTVKKILHIIPTTDFGGITTMIVDTWLNVNKSLYHFDFVSFNKGPYHDILLQQGSKIFYETYITEQGPLSYMRNIYRIIKQYQYDAVHDHTGYRAVFTMLAARLAGVTCRVLHSHTNVAEEWNNKALLALLKRLSVGNATRLVACSQKAGEFCFDKKSYEVVANPIDMQKIERLSSAEKKNLAEGLGIQDGDLVIGHIGRFVPVKNHPFLIELAATLKQKGIPFKLLLIGDGPLEQEVRYLVKQRNLEDCVRFLGQRADIIKLLQLMDKFILPSHFEGFGIVLLEAQICGTPAIVSSTLPKEVDLNVGLLQYIDLQGEVDHWLQAISENNEKIDPQIIRKSLKNKGFDAQVIATRLCALYT